MDWKSVGIRPSSEVLWLDSTVTNEVNLLPLFSIFLLSFAQCNFTRVNWILFGSFPHKITPATTTPVKAVLIANPWLELLDAPSKCSFVSLCESICTIDHIYHYENLFTFCLPKWLCHKAFWETSQPSNYAATLNMSHKKCNNKTTVYMTL